MEEKKFPRKIGDQISFPINNGIDTSQNYRISFTRCGERYYKVQVSFSDVRSKVSNCWNEIMQLYMRKNQTDEISTKAFKKLLASHYSSIRNAKRVNDYISFKKKAILSAPAFSGEMTVKTILAFKLFRSWLKQTKFQVE